MAILNKLEIEYKDAAKTDVSFTFQYNPSKLKITKEATWADVDASQKDVSDKQFSAGKPKVLTIDDVLFDTSMSGSTSVYTKSIQMLEVMTLVQDYKDDNNLVVPRPPHLTLLWGSATYLFKCVLKSLTYEFTMFNRKGEPIRANVNMTFEEIIPETKATLTASNSVSEYTVTSASDTLQKIAQSQMSDARKWKIIAIANGIDDPTFLTVGMKLKIPS
jgi:hypothetical protein